MAEELIPHNPLPPAVPAPRRAPYPDYVALPAQDAPDDDPAHGGLLEYWRILRRRKGTVILIAFLGALLGFLVTLPQTPIYQAKTSVEIVGLNDNFMNIKQVNPVTQTGATSETSDIQTQIKILQSESLIERVVSKLKLNQKPVPTAPADRISAWRKALNLPEPAPADSLQQAVTYATKNLKVRAAGQTRIIEITVDSPDPRMASAFADTLATEFIDQNLESRWKTTERTSEWLTRQLDDMRVKLEHSEEKLQDYARQAGLIFTQEKSNVDEEKLRQIQTTLTTATADRIAKQSRYEMATSAPAESLPDILNDAGLREYQSKLTELKRQIAELIETYTPEHPKVRRVQAQFATIETAQNRERSAILKRIKNEYDEALRKEKLISVDYRSQTGLVSGLGEKAIQYNILKREVDSNRTVYDLMLQQLKQATIASALRASNVRVVDPAKVPRTPYKPDPKQSAGVGLLAGLFLGVGFVVMRERADRTIQQPGDAPFWLQVPELGVIPSNSSGARLRITYYYRKPEKRQPKAIADAQSVELVTWQKKTSMVSEAFRSTLISILFSGENGYRPRTIVLTSPNPTEGKSTIVSNLAIAIAEVGNRVLIIDADLRKPRQHSIFSLDSKPGLTELLRSRINGKGAPPPESLDAAKVILATAVPNLYVLPAGESTQAALNLLYGNQMADLLRTLRDQFDTILIDTPPMLQISDARVIARITDRVILVVRSAQTTRDAAQAAMHRFREDGTKVLGTILNDWNPKHSTDGYYGGYSYYKGYKHYYGNDESKS